MKRKVVFLLVICLTFTLVTAGCKRSKVDPKPDPGPEVPEVLGIEISEKGTYQIDFADLDWRKLGAYLITELNKMEAYNNYGNNPKGMVTGDNLAEPDLSALTGGGLYIEEVTDSQYDLIITNITWSGTETLTETFYMYEEGEGEQGDQGQQRIVQWKGYEEIAKSPNTGFPWGAFVINPDADQNTVIMDGYWSGRLQFMGISQNEKTDEPDYKPIAGNQAGSYCYTIFDEAGGNHPTKTVTNMATGKIIIGFDYETGVGDQFPEKIRVLIRDNKGDWFLSAGGTAIKL